MDLKNFVNSKTTEPKGKGHDYGKRDFKKFKAGY